MSFRFWVLAAAYHGALVAVCVLRARRWRHREALPPKRGGFWRSVLGDFLSCGTAAFLLAFPLAVLLPDPPFAAIRFWSQALFGEALLYLLFLAVLHWRGGLVLRSLLLAAPALVLLAVYVDAYHVEPRLLRVEEHQVTLAGGPREIRLLHISDIQASRIGSYERRVVKLAAELEPDIVVLTGDFIHERLLPTGLQAGRELAEALRRHGPRAPLGTWAVGGDTDGAETERLLVDSGVGWLEDEVVTVPLPGGLPLTLVGLAPETSRGLRPETLRRLVAEAAPDSPQVVFGHAPDYVLDLELGGGPRVDLALAGHTHGGQIVVPFFGPPLTLSRVPRSVAAGGLHQLGRVRVHVSRGVGMERGSAPQVRFLCPPEICVLTLRY